MTDEQAPRRAVMHPEQVWQVIDAQRRGLADLLEDLPDEQWRHPSLCPDWTVRDVAAHLTLQQLGLRDVIAMVARWPGSMDRTIHHVACRRAAAMPTEEIVAEIRGLVGSRRSTVGVTHLETLIDILVHGQDIAIRRVAARTCRRRSRPSPRTGCCPCTGPHRLRRSAWWPDSSWPQPTRPGPPVRARRSWAPRRRSSWCAPVASPPCPSCAVLAPPPSPPASRPPRRHRPRRRPHPGRDQRGHPALCADRRRRSHTGNSLISAESS